MTNFINQNWEAFKDEKIANQVWFQTTKAQVYKAAGKFEEAFQCQKKIVNHFLDLVKFNKIQDLRIPQLNKQENQPEIPHSYFKIQGDHIYQKLPQKVEISQNQYGGCMVAGRDLKKGEVIFRTSYLYIDENILKEDYIFHVQGKVQTTFGFNKKVHSAKHQGARMVYGFDSNTNHSCDPTTYVIFYEDGIYQQVALQDISKGEQLNSNYAAFDYECDGHQIPECRCLAINCRKKMMGFKNLPAEEQLKLIPTINPLLLSTFLKDQKIADLRTLSPSQNWEINYDFNNQKIIFTSKAQTSQYEEILNLKQILQKSSALELKGLYKTKDGLRIQANIPVILKRSEIRQIKSFEFDENQLKITAKEIIPADSEIIVSYKLE